MLIHCPRRLRAAAPVLAAEVPYADGVLTMWAGEHRHATHYLDGVMSHSFKSSPSSRYGSEPKFLKAGMGINQRSWRASRFDQSVFTLCRQIAAGCAKATVQ
jgi:hypothetical protein